MLQRALSRPPGRILMTTDAVGGVWRHTIDVCEGLAARGAEIVLVGLGPRPRPAQEAEARGIDGVELVWIDIALDWMAEGLWEVEDLPQALADLAREHAVDLVHVSAPSQAASLLVPCPVVATAHSCVATWWAAVRGGDVPEAWGWRMNLNRLGFVVADVALAPCASFAAALRMTYGPLPRLDVARNGRPLRAAPGARKEPFVLSVGRWWDAGKNLALLDAAARDMDWPVRLVGALAGPDGSSVRAGAAETLGVLRPLDLERLYDLASIFVAPSVYEPFGLAVLEAAQAGAALVLADIPTFRELWDDAALFADPRDAAALAAAVNRLAAEPELRARLGRAARERSKRYPIEAQIEALIAAYSQAAAARDRALAPLRA